MTKDTFLINHNITYSKEIAFTKKNEIKKVLGDLKLGFDYLDNYSKWGKNGKNAMKLVK